MYQGKGGRVWQDSRTPESSTRSRPAATRAYMSGSSSSGDVAVAW